MTEPTAPSSPDPHGHDRVGPARLDGETVLNDAIHRFPETVSVFHRHGIDGCCGGALPIEEACRRHGVDPEAVLDELRSVAGAGS